MIVLAGGNAYTLVHEHKTAWNAEAFRERYSEVLERYDYIVGDWGYSQLRLRGFYTDNHPKATKETAIASLTDYLNEYCNFGCAYFVLAKTDAAAVPPGTPDLTASPQGEAEAQAAETAAAAAAGTGGILMRWPLKERPGGPVRMPGAAAMARAAQEAERRNQQAAKAKAEEHKGAQGGRSGQDGGRGGRPYGGGGADKRTGGAGNAEHRQGGRPQQGPPHRQKPGGPEGRHGAGGPVGKPNAGPRQHADGGASGGRPLESARPQEGGRGPEGGRPPEAARSDGHKSGGSRWPGKNRRRRSFGGGKPNRPDGPPKDGGPSSAGKPGAD